MYIYTYAISTEPIERSVALSIFRSADLVVCVHGDASTIVIFSIAVPVVFQLRT